MKSLRREEGMGVAQHVLAVAPLAVLIALVVWALLVAGPLIGS